MSERIAALEVEKTELSAAVESAKKDADAVKAELASVKKAPAVPSVKSQEFKKNAQPVVASNGNSSGNTGAGGGAGAAGSVYVFVR